MTSTSSDLIREFVQFSRWKLVEQYWPRMRECVASLTNDQIWWRPNAASNSVGNLLLHLNGNVRQWLIVPFTHAEDARDRPAEFAERRVLPTATLIDMLEATMRDAADVLDRLTEAELVRGYELQGHAVTGLHAVYQVVEHFGMHYGQVLYVTKQLRGEDLGFYRGLDKTGRAS